MIEGVQGDIIVPAPGSVGGFEVLSYSWAVEAATGSGSSSGGAGAGRATFGDFVVTMPVGRSAPVLYVAVASGIHYRSAVLLVVDAVRRGAAPREVERYTMEDVFCLSLRNTGAQGGARDMSELHLGYVALTHKVTTYDAAGKPLSVEHTWNRMTNKGK
jgi:type VI protein secretion system component Hcp